MTVPLSTPDREDYGIDAPSVVRNNVLIGLLLCLLGAGMLFLPVSLFGGWGATAILVVFFAGFSLLLTSGVMVYGSRVGKLRLRDRLLNQLPWRGDERVLDVGCGRGLMLVGAARRLSTGRVIGLDVWHGVDQSGNSPRQTLANARAAGVAARIDLTTGDARAMPYPDSAFDVVTSSWVIHNIRGREEREKAVREVLRVVRPGGWIAIADIERIDEYMDWMEQAGVKHIQRSRPYYVFAIPTYTLLARKP